MASQPQAAQNDPAKEVIDVTITGTLPSTAPSTLNGIQDSIHAHEDLVKDAPKKVSILFRPKGDKNDRPLEKKGALTAAIDAFHAQISKAENDK